MAMASTRMMIVRRWAPVIAVAAALVVLSVLGTAAEAARPLVDGGVDGWVAAGGGGGAAASIVETLRRLYLQQLGGPGASCGTNSPNNGCPP
ncbi:Os06g0249350 [Oryza sativa Japonica Group]|uniref:Uncharacterized protein n=4 Tax=Oryza sativa TaxID=4530 RepID=A0A8J8XXI4_ORYSJ|nr:uncharacterized protein LOC9267858 [Oryza sativa Japonica Group]EEC80329.1 hypothetical protein OsI_22380 [Oryza sativa Indica Group]KAB8101963.1 hypothetical protein EE612_033103 [Oryza sativa]EEE65454.1 hypothetical protein OsJ_20822 [Oryza sativa Japonica Group]KAF2926094.1 hypothetical protein DAI22_06g101166 [Oryza sativa Japonica Group]BAS97049.1 Os06g0249350 [Oryza sativa Japonica Group]